MKKEKQMNSLMSYLSSTTKYLNLFAFELKVYCNESINIGILFIAVLKITNYS